MTLSYDALQMLSLRTFVAAALNLPRCHLHMPCTQGRNEVRWRHHVRT